MNEKIIGYKLIKEYPESSCYFKLGDIVHKDHDGMCGPYYMLKESNKYGSKKALSEIDLKNFPEFWEPIYEEEIKIVIADILQAVRKEFTNELCYTGLNIYGHKVASKTIELIADYLRKYNNWDDVGKEHFIKLWKSKII